MIPHVLITDDDDDFRSVLCEGLQGRGLLLHQASDGEEALQLLRREPIHMVLVDFHMPKLTGLEVIRVLSEQSQPMPCVLMSAMLDETIEQEAARMRAYRVLQKPIRLSQIREIVCRGLHETYGWQPSL